MWNLYPAQMNTPFERGCCDYEGQNCHFQDHYEHMPNLQSCSPFPLEPTTPVVDACQPGCQVVCQGVDYDTNCHAPCIDYGYGKEINCGMANGPNGQEPYHCYYHYVQNDDGTKELHHHHYQHEYQEHSHQHFVQQDHSVSFAARDQAQPFQHGVPQQDFSIPSPKRQLLEHVIGKHVTSQDNCSACKLRSEDGSEQVISLNDLVDIVAKTMESVQEKFPKEEKIAPSDSGKPGTTMTKKRLQNKEAAARYRKRQKSKLVLMQEEIVGLEVTRNQLQDQVAKLAEEIKKQRQILALD